MELAPDGRAELVCVADRPPGQRGLVELALIMSQSWWPDGLSRRCIRLACAFTSSSSGVQGVRVSEAALLELKATAPAPRDHLRGRPFGWTAGAWAEAARRGRRKPLSPRQRRRCLQGRCL